MRACIECILAFPHEQLHRHAISHSPLTSAGGLLQIVLQVSATARTFHKQQNQDC